MKRNTGKHLGKLHEHIASSALYNSKGLFTLLASRHNFRGQRICTFVSNRSPYKSKINDMRANGFHQYIFNHLDFRLCECFIIKTSPVNRVLTACEVVLETSENNNEQDEED